MDMIPNPRAIREILSREVTHRCNRYLNNRLEQDHRGIKQRSYPMRGFGSAASASRFCRAFDEVRQFFRVRTTMKQKGSLMQQREIFRQRLDALKALVQVASHRRMVGEKCPTHFVASSVLSSDTSKHLSVCGVAPGLHYLPQNGKFPDMIGIVICHQQDLAQDGLPGSMRDRCVQVQRGIGDHLPQHLQVDKK
jgi:hypothetical protein